MFKFVHVGGPYGDCTSSYHLELDKKYSVGEFIETVLKEMPDEWGYIGIYFKGNVFGYPQCEYNHGVILDSSFSKDQLTFEIENVHASGGWSRMDYLINLDFDEIKRTNHEALIKFNNMIAERRKRELETSRTIDISLVEMPETLPARKKR